MSPRQNNVYGKKRTLKTTSTAFADKTSINKTKSHPLKRPDPTTTHPSTKPKDSSRWSPPTRASKSKHASIASLSEEEIYPEERPITRRQPEIKMDREIEVFDMAPFEDMDLVVEEEEQDVGSPSNRDMDLVVEEEAKELPINKDIELPHIDLDGGQEISPSLPLPGTCLLLITQQNISTITPISIKLSSTFPLRTLKKPEIQSAIKAIINLTLRNPGVLKTPKYTLFFQRSPASVARDYTFTVYGREVPCGDKWCFYIDASEAEGKEVSKFQRSSMTPKDCRDQMMGILKDEMEEEHILANETDQEDVMEEDENSMEQNAVVETDEDDEREVLGKYPLRALAGRGKEDKPADREEDPLAYEGEEEDSLAGRGEEDEIGISSGSREEVEVNLSPKQKKDLLHKMGFEDGSALPSKIVIPKPSLFGTIKSWFI